MSLIPSIVSSGSSQDPNNKGWFTTPAALSAAYPTGENGWFAIVGSTDTVWVWDVGTGDWVDSGASGTGDVTGPATSTNNNVALFDGTTGKVIKDGGALGALASRNIVASADIDSGAVDTIQLASDAVTTPKITDGNVSDAKLGTGINANKISSGAVSNTEFDYLNGTTSNIQTQIDAKLAEANSIFMPGYTKYCVDNRDDLATVIASITNESTVINISQGSFGGATPLSINKDNIALIAPPATPAIVEFAYEISTATTADQIRMRYMQFDNDFNAGSRRSTYNHCTFNQDLNIQTSATAGYMTFANCEFAADTTISVQNTFGSTVYFINCNFAGCSFSLNQASNLQVIFSNCSNFISFPTNATYTHTNILTNGYAQNSVTKTLLATGSGTAGQVLASGGAGLPDTWATPVSSTTDLSDVSVTAPLNNQVLQYNSAASEYQPITLSTGSGDVTGPASSTDSNVASFDGATGKIIQDGGITTSAISSAISQTNTNTTDIASNTAAIGTKISASSTDTLTNKTLIAPIVSGLELSDSSIIFEGSATDNNETTLSVEDPTVDRTITFPDQSGRIPLLSNNSNDLITAAPVEINILDGVTATTAEINYLNGVTSDIQTQIDTKAPLASPNFTGTVSSNNLSTVGVSATSVNTTSLQSGSFQLGSTATTGYVLKTDATGTGTWQPESGGGGGGVTLPYKIVRTTGGDYSTVYDAVQAGEQYIFVDGTMMPVIETNDIVSSGQTEVINNVYIKIIGEWQPKRFMQSTSNDLVIEAGNGIWSGTIRMQIPTSPTEAEFLGRSFSFGTETNETILDGIVWDTTQMTANDYGKFSPTGVFISINVKVALPNYSGNGLSWNLNTINAPSLAQGQTIINGGGLSCAKGIELGDELIIDALEIRGEFTRNNIESDVLLGSAVVFGDPSNFPMVEIKKINWAVSNITSGDAYAIVAGGNLSNFDKPSNQTNSTTGKLELYLYYDESNLDNIDFGAGKIVQATGGTNVTVNNCTTIDSVDYNSSGSPSWTGWKFNNCEFSNITSISVIIPNAVYENCTFASTVQSFSTVNERTFRNCTFNGSVSLAGNKNRVDNCTGASTLTFNGNDNIICNSMIDSDISGNGDRSKFLCNNTISFNSGITVNGDYNYFAGNTFRRALNVNGQYNLQPANSNVIY